MGSTPGNNTKKIGTVFDVSANVSEISNGGYSTNRSPIFSDTNRFKADGNLSGLIALKSNNF